MNSSPPSSALEHRDGTRPPARLGIGKLSRKLKGRWIHPQTSFYFQAFIDALLFVILGSVLYEAAMAIRLATFSSGGGPSYVLLQAPFFVLLARSSWVATVFAMATGFSIGGFYEALKRWKLEEVADEPGASDPEQATANPTRCRVRKYVTLGRLRMPYWLYMTSTVILALALPGFASVTIHGIWSCWNAYLQHPTEFASYFFQPSMGSFVGTIMFCAIDVVAIVARLIIVMRCLPRLEPTSREDIGEKWETTVSAATRTA